MSLFSDAAKSAMLSALAIDELSLHSSYAVDGGNEISGGDPPYARPTVSFSAPSAGIQKLIGAPYLIDVPACEVAWIGMWSGGEWRGMSPNGGDQIKPFSVDELAPDSIQSAGHKYTVGTAIVVWANSAGPLPGALSEGTIYYVVAVSADTLQVSDTLGGDSMSLLQVGNGFIQKIIPVSFTSQSQFPINGLTIDASVAA